MTLVRFTQKLAGEPRRDVWVNPDQVCFVHPVNKRTLIGIHNWSFLVNETVEDVVKRFNGEPW